MQLKGKRIYVVEDNPGNRAIMTTLLMQAGAITATDRWGRDTCRMIREFMPVDGILLDLMLPGGVTGYQVFSDIRADAQLAAVPIIAVSASDADIEGPKVRAAGFAGFISKPVRVPTFALYVADILEGRPVWGT